MRRLLAIASFLLIGSILFGQIGVDFMHDPHNAHEKTVKLDGPHKTIQKHGEHCKVCSIDLFINLFVENDTTTPSREMSSTTIATDPFNHGFVFSTPTRGRAPPLA